MTGTVTVTVTVTTTAIVIVTSHNSSAVTEKLLARVFGKYLDFFLSKKKCRS